MSVIYIALPVALVIALIAIITFVVQVKNGQFDDLESPAQRVLFDDVEHESISHDARSGQTGQDPVSPNENRAD